MFWEGATQILLLHRMATTEHSNWRGFSQTGASRGQWVSLIFLIRDTTLRHPAPFAG
jgi:hypothetical protein